MTDLEMQTPVHLDERGEVERVIVDHALVDDSDGERAEIVGVIDATTLWVRRPEYPKMRFGLPVSLFGHLGGPNAWKLDRVLVAAGEAAR